MHAKFKTQEKVQDTYTSQQFPINRLGVITKKVNSSDNTYTGTIVFKDCVGQKLFFFENGIINSWSAQSAPEFEIRLLRPDEVVEIHN